MSERSTTRPVRMFAAVHPSGGMTAVRLSRDNVQACMTDVMHLEGWCIVPVTVTIDARATLSPTDSKEDA